MIPATWLPWLSGWLVSVRQSDADAQIRAGTVRFAARSGCCGSKPPSTIPVVVCGALRRIDSRKFHACGNLADSSPQLPFVPVDAQLHGSAFVAAESPEP